LDLRRISAAKHARKIVDVCVNVKPSESILVVTDTANFEFGEVFANAVAATGAEAVLTVMTPRKYHYQPPPRAVCEAAKNCDALIGAASTFFEAHNVQAFETLKAGTRVYGFSGGTLDLLASESFEADFVRIHPIVEKLVQLESESKKIQITAPNGTNLTFGVGRKGVVTSGVLTGPGQFTSGPNIEANMSPMEGTSIGTIVADAALTPYWSPLDGIIKATVESGRIVNIDGGKSAQEWRQFLTNARDENVYNIAQFAIGMNPFCKISGIGPGIDDEGVYGTCHFGTGTSIILGGRVVAPFHFDLVLWKPTIMLDGKVIEKDGLLVPEQIGIEASRLTELGFAVAKH